MGITALPYTAVLAVPANRLLGSDNASTGPAEALTAAEVRTLLSVYTTTQVDTLLSGKAATVHVHAASDITSGTLDIARIPTGSTSSTVCIGNDSRLSDARTPLAHVHAASDITSGTLDIARIPTGTTSSTVCIGNDSRLSDSRTPTAHKTSHATGGTDALSPSDIGAVPTSRTLTINGTAYDLSANRSWTVSGGIGGSTGTVDNAMLRADGTGGATAQASDWLIADNYTASPNNTVNHASLQATGSTTNVSVSVVPKGSGAFSLSVPDGTSTGGNARGANAVDLQTTRNAASQVASGAGSGIIYGRRSTASGLSAVAGGDDSTASGSFSIAIGNYNAATNYAAVSIGINGVASGNQSFALSMIGGGTASGQNAFIAGSGVSSGAASWGTGFAVAANRAGMAAYAQGSFAANGDAQFVRWVLRNKTTDGTTAVTLFADGSSARCLLTSGKVLHANIRIVGSKSDGSAVAVYLRQVAIKNVGGTTSLVGTVNTIGTDTAASTSIAITADDTNDALQIAVTGIASETWRWVATVEGVELAYGT